MEDEEAGKGRVGIEVSKPDATVRKASAAVRPSRFGPNRLAQLVGVLACQW